MHLIFDLDGTLINSLPGISSALNASLVEHELPTYSEQIVRDFIGDGSHTLCRRAAPDANDSLVDSLNSAFKKHYQTCWQAGTNIYSGVGELIDSIPEHHHLSILSNKPHAFTTEIVETLFPADTFDTVLGQREGITKKPDPAGVYEITKCSDHHDKHAVLIGDSTVDLQTAKNARIRSIAVTWGFEDLELLKPLIPDHIVSNTTELLSLIHTF